MVLLLGTEAYSPFRMDAIRESIAKLAPELGPLNVDARWVYALELTDSPSSSARPRSSMRTETAMGRTST